jgi:hypothetical protein
MDQRIRVKKNLLSPRAPTFLRDMARFKRMMAKSSRPMDVQIKDMYPCLGENTSGIGFDSHYIYHTAWAARKLQEIKPAKHVDISSSLYFAAIASAFVPMDYYEFRCSGIKLDNYLERRGDLMHLPMEAGSVRSLSCMHVLEHLGLGRYGDQMDPDGDIKGARELERVLASGGDLLFVVPVGKPKIEFNAHRIYSYQGVMSLFPGLTLKEFTLIRLKNKQTLLKNASGEDVELEDYGCGCFWFKKP